MPSIGFLGLVFAGIALLGVLGKVQEKISKFDIVMPVLNVCWIFLAAKYAINQGLTTATTFGWVAMVAAIATWRLHGGLPTGSRRATSARHPLLLQEAC